ncbi:hypothetical protein MPER_16413, partial [Moniliophthora perniciosa FA553]
QPTNLAGYGVMSFESSNIKYLSWATKLGTIYRLKSALFQPDARGIRLPYWITRQFIISFRMRTFTHLHIDHFSRNYLGEDLPGRKEMNTSISAGFSRRPSPSLIFAKNKLY